MSVYIDGTPPAPESVIVSSSIKTSNLLKKTNPSDSQQQLSLPGDQLTLDFTTDEHLHEVYVTVDGKEYPATGSATQWNVITDTTIPLTANQEVSFFLSRYTDLAGNEQVTPTETATKGTDSMSVYIDGTPPAPESVIVSSSIKTSNLLKKTNPSDSQQQLSLPGDQLTLDFTTDDHLHEVHVTVDDGRSILRQDPKTNPSDHNSSWKVITDTTIPLTANQGMVSFFLSRYTDLAGNEQVTPTETATKGTDSMSVYIDGTPPAPESVIVSSSIKTSNLLKKTNPSDSQQQLSLPGDQLTLDFTTDEHLHEVYVTVDGKEYPATGSAYSVEGHNRYNDSTDSESGGFLLPQPLYGSCR